MRAFLVTSAPTYHIMGASLHQWRKYTPFNILELDVGSTPLDQWASKIYELLSKELRPNEKKIIFGLDDYLVIDQFKKEVFDEVNKMGFDRYEMGWGALNKKPNTTLKVYDGWHISQYNKDAFYLSSCQISVWNVETLLFILKRCTSPWDFEIKGTEIFRKIKNFKVLGTSGKFALRWQEESSLSFHRNKNKINVLGVRPRDVKEMVKLKFLDKSKLNYGINNGPRYLLPDKGGRKYLEFYEN